MVDDRSSTIDHQPSTFFKLETCGTGEVNEMKGVNGENSELRAVLILFNFTTLQLYNLHSPFSIHRSPFSIPCRESPLLRTRVVLRKFRWWNM